MERHLNNEDILKWGNYNRNQIFFILRWTELLNVHTHASAKERDVYRQRFLESKGWKVTRIWSRSWWRNSSIEIERIDQLIKQLVEDESIKSEVLRR
ncbi:DUF559 domain-containing protein [Bacillus sp. AK128]